MAFPQEGSIFLRHVTEQGGFLFVSTAIVAGSQDETEIGFVEQKWVVKTGPWVGDRHLVEN